MESERKDLGLEDIPGVSCPFSNAFLRIALARESSSVTVEPFAATAWRLLRRSAAEAGGCTVAALTMHGGSVVVATPNMAGGPAPGETVPCPPDAEVDWVGDETCVTGPPSAEEDPHRPPPEVVEEGEAGVARSIGIPPTMRGERPTAGTPSPKVDVDGAAWPTRVAGTPPAGDDEQRPPPCVAEEGEAGVTSSRGPPAVEGEAV